MTIATHALLTDIVLRVANYAAVRALTSTSPATVYVAADGVAGAFAYDSTDVTSADNGGTILVDAAGHRWKRQYAGAVWVNWFGTDAAAWKSAIGLFSNGKTLTASGEIAASGIFNITTPVVIPGSPSLALTVRGFAAGGRDTTNGTCISWTGAATQSAVIFYGANETVWDGINIDATQGSGAIRAVHIMADNISAMTTTLAGSVTAGSNVAVAVTALGSITIGTALGIDTGANFEIIYVKKVAGSTITADFTKNHANGAAVGGSGGSSGVRLSNMSVKVDIPINTTLSVGVAAGAGIVTTPASMTNIVVGSELVIDTLGLLETVKVTAVTGSTFTATYTLNHLAGVQIIAATSGITWGNASSLDTMQVSEGHTTSVKVFTKDGSAGNCYAAQRFITGGNVKNFFSTDVTTSGFKFPAAIEAGSGVYEFLHPNFGNTTEAEFLFNGAGSLLCTSLEAESPTGHRLLTGSTSLGSATFINNSWECICPADDYGIVYSGTIGLYNNELFNDFGGVRVFKVQCADVTGYGSHTTLNPSVIVSRGNYYHNAGPGVGVFYDSSSNCANVGDVAASNVYARLTSKGDYGSHGQMPSVESASAALSAGLSTAFTSAGITFDRFSTVDGTCSVATLPYTAFQVASATKDLTVFGVPAGAGHTRCIIDTTAGFTGAGATTLQVGSTAGGAEMILAHSAAAPVTKGLADADMGASMTRAAMVQGCYTPNWAADTKVYVRATAGAGNLSGLAAGSATLYCHVSRGK